MSLPTSSLAAIFHAPLQPFELRDIDIPLPTPGTILVEVLLCTICGSDLHTYSGRRSVLTPSVLGHEMVGRLVWPNKVTDGVGKTVRAGERLIWSLASSCGSCVFCSSGLPQKCEALMKYGHRVISPEWPLSGGLAEYCMLVPGTFVLGVPDPVPDAIAAPATCATATVSSAIGCAGEIAGKTVLVMGAGMLGNTACAMLDAMSAKKVIVADADFNRAQSASKFGARHALSARLEPDGFVEAVRDCSDGYGADVVVELAGENGAVDRALRSTKIGGVCLLVGSVYPQEPLPIAIEEIVRRMLNVRGVYNYAPVDLVKALEFLTTEAYRYPFIDLVGGDFTLAQVQSAFETAGSTTSPYRVAVRPNLRGGQS